MSKYGGPMRVQMHKFSAWDFCRYEVCIAEFGSGVFSWATRWSRKACYLVSGSIFRSRRSKYLLDVSIGWGVSFVA